LDIAQPFPPKRVGVDNGSEVAACESEAWNGWNFDPLRNELPSEVVVLANEKAMMCV